MLLLWLGTGILGAAEAAVPQTRPRGGHNWAEEERRGTLDALDDLGTLNLVKNARRKARKQPKAAPESTAEPVAVLYAAKKPDVVLNPTAPVVNFDAPLDPDVVDVLGLGPVRQTYALELLLLVA